MKITIIFLVACASNCYSSTYSTLLESLTNYKGNDVQKIQEHFYVKKAKKKANTKRGTAENQDLNKFSKSYRGDPVQDFWARRRSPTSEESSSSLELPDWKEEWKEEWLQKKIEAVNSSLPEGDTVNMLAARPWGVSCGDPNQHDVPWGSCMLPMECEPEFRIYRGDYFCGRTQFVCCALLVSTYDTNQGFDASFADSSLETDSEEIRNRDVGSKERSKRKKKKDTNQRKRNREKRKKEIKKNIKKIIKEIRKVLSKSYRNGTAARKKKTRQLKKFIQGLKKEFKKDRMAVQSIHERELENIDKLLQQKLDQIKGMNLDFIRNHTFGDIVVNGSISPNVMRQLLKAYPDSDKMQETRRSVPSRGSVRPDYLDYDIEYGPL